MELHVFLRKFRKLVALVFASPLWLLGRLSQHYHRERNQVKKTFYYLEQLAYKESAKYIFEHMQKAVLLTNLREFRRFAIQQAPSSGLLMEFGVYKGDSINQYAKELSSMDDVRTIFGFDSFEGLSEHWAGYSLLSAKFDRKGRLPKVRDNVELVKGWVDETYVPFLKQQLDAHEQKIAFMFLDMDTYTPTHYVLERSLPYLKKGSIIAFDELLGYTGWRENEYKALMQTVAKAYDFDFICYSEHRKLGYVSMYVRAAIRITGRK